MVLVDTSVLIDYLRGRENDKTALFSKVLERDIPFGISAYTYQELLQGAKDDKEFDTLDAYLSTQKIYSLPPDALTHKKAARIFYDLRRKGVTVRGIIDVLIAMTAIEHDLALLHNDRDFDNMASVLEQLKILNQF